MKYLMTGFTAFLFFLATVTSLSAQNKNSVQGDYEALQALYNSTQGQGVPTLNSTSALPTSSRDAEYPYMYMINGELHYLEIERTREFVDNHAASWVNAGAPWKDTAGWTNMTPETMGDAVGIEVDSDGRVIVIDMQKVTTVLFEDAYFTAGNNLVGTLPVEIGNLRRLTHFNVKQNFFHGEIPSSIKNWKESVRLSFAGQLWELDIESRHQWHEDHRDGRSEPFADANSVYKGKKIMATNRFRTKVPAEIDGFQHLELIELRYQYLTGTLPAWNNLPSLKGIFLDDARDSGPNTISGSIPDSWGNLTSVRYWKMQAYHANGRYSGDFPQSINNNWNELNNISIQGHSFTGPIPEFLSSRDKIYVALSNNEFTGGFPAGYFNGDNARLSKWQIGSNNLSGEIPKTITTPVYPRERSNYAIDAPGIGRNNFTGSIPEWYMTMIGMQTFFIANNNFNGPFPAAIATQNNLKTFYIHNNNFSGPLPDIDWGDRRIGWFFIQNNNFEGVIPDSWITLFQDGDGNWHNNVRRINLYNNNLSGRIPDWPKNLDIDQYRLDANRYTFIDIGPVYQDLKDAIGDGFSVDNQKPFGREQSRTMPEGDTVVFDLSDYDYPGNTYQWLRNGTQIGGVNTPVLTIESVSGEDEGSYVLEVINSNLTELGTHQSQPIHFQIGEDDGGNGYDDGNSDGDDNSSGDGDNNNENGQDDEAIFPNAPFQKYPANNGENSSLTPSFAWYDIGADYYVLHSDRNNPSGMVIEVVVEDTTFTPSEILGADATHYWRVRGVKDGEAGEWSLVWKFTTQDANIPEMPDLIAPENRAESVNTDLWLEWTTVEADFYKIRLRNSENNEWMMNEESVDTQYRMPWPLEENKEYTWQVKSVLNGVEGAWSPLWEFSTGIYEVFVEAPPLIAPVHGSEYSTLNPVFEWENIDADQYVLEVLRDEPSNSKRLSSSADQNVVLTKEIRENHYSTRESLDPEKTYYWRVKALKDDVEGEWSETWEFKTPAEVTANIDENERPLETALSQNYPNPFNPTTQIEFSLSKAQKVSLKVYNMAGREVANLVNGLLNAGSYSVTFNAGHLSSGVYFYRYATRNQSFTKKMTLVK